MSVVAEFRLPHEEFALAETFAVEPDLVVEAERAVATPTDRLFPHVWLRGHDFDDSVHPAEDPTVETAREIARTEAGRLYTVEWADIVQERIQSTLDRNVSVLQFLGDSCGWHARIRVPEHAYLSEFQDLLIRADVDVEIERIYRPQTPNASSLDSLTTKQRAAVVTAVELGFYEVPRATSMGAVAEELGISQQALSKRLRRAHAAIIGETVSGNVAKATVRR
jgi:predicted DNA binding protein